MILLPQSNDVPHAIPSSVSAPFWEGCHRGELLFQRCSTCGSAAFPPSEHCRNCLSFDQRWEQSAGIGRLYSWTVVHRPVTPAFVTPYVPAIVDLAEGYQMLTNIVGADHDSLVTNMELQVTFHQVNAELVLPYFEPTHR